MRLGLARRRLSADVAEANAQIRALASALACEKKEALERAISEKQRIRREDEAMKPLASYRDEELLRMKRNFFGFDPSYHVARYNFIRKVPKSRTPVTLALHRAARRRG